MWKKKNSLETKENWVAQEFKATLSIFDVIKF